MSRVENRWSKCWCGKQVNLKIFYFWLPTGRTISLFVGFSSSDGLVGVSVRLGVHQQEQSPSGALCSVCWHLSASHGHMSSPESCTGYIDILHGLLAQEE